MTRDRIHAASLSAALKDVPPVAAPREMKYARHVYHVYAVRAAGGNGSSRLWRQEVSPAGCTTRSRSTCSAPTPHRGEGIGSFPVAERCAQEFVSLPMFPELTEEQIVYVGGELARLAESVGRAR